MAIQRTVTVCWTPNQSTSTHAFLDDKNVKYTNDVIPVTEPTTFNFVTSKACSDPGVYPFTMTIAPDPAVNDITVITSAGPTVAFTANYKVVNQQDQLRMTLLTQQSGGKSYTIESGRPIIRNDPHRTFNPVHLLAGVIVVVIVVTIIWRIFQARMNPE